ncbi:MAG: putative toxin-antitoxin system toxin component, PIN family [Egibacteraceae bacterium]
MTRRPRYLLDTEAILRAWRDDGPARELLQLGMIRNVSLCASTTILDEVDEVLARPKFGANPVQRQALRRSVLAAADTVAVFREHEAPRRSPDPGDDHVIESALRSAADVVVSRNTADLSNPAFEVLDSGPACQRMRAGRPYGSTTLLTVAEQQEQVVHLVEKDAAGSTRLGADEQFRAITAVRSATLTDPDWQAVALSPSDTVTLATQLVHACGMGLVFNARNGDHFDYVSGIWTDVAGRGGMVPLDLIWYSSDRAKHEVIERPDPTVAGWGWPDEARYRYLLAGGLVLVIKHPGPQGEPDVRCLIFMAEPLYPVPNTTTAYRRLRCLDDKIDSLSMDPAGLVTGLDVWLPGGAGGLLSATPLDHRGLKTVFHLADEISTQLGWPAQTSLHP